MVGLHDFTELPCAWPCCDLSTEHSTTGDNNSLSELVMASFLHRLRAPAQDQPQSQLSSPQTPKTGHQPIMPKDPNTPDSRFQLQQKCIYERALPGKAYISAHVNRLQHGFYQSNATHEHPLDNVYFVSVHFVFHPADAISHRFKSATIRVGVHGDFNQSDDPKYNWYYPPFASPKFLKHAPELIYGAVSPETLQWNFSLSSSLGVTQTPVSASLNPSGGVKASYKVFTMMSIQGSLRTLRSPLSPAYDVEDGLAVWTLEENSLQRSGLPREFDFVLLVHRPDDVQNMYLSVDVDSVIDAWFGHYPQWYTNLQSHQPLHRQLLNFHTEIGQKFQPSKPGKGFNFADLPKPLDDYVSMPGTTYPTSVGYGLIVHEYNSNYPYRTRQAPLIQARANIQRSFRILNQMLTISRRITLEEIAPRAGIVSALVTPATGTAGVQTL